MHKKHKGCEWIFYKGRCIINEIHVWCVTDARGADTTIQELKRDLTSKQRRRCKEVVNCKPFEWRYDERQKCGNCSKR